MYTGLGLIDNVFLPFWGWSSLRWVRLEFWNTLSKPEEDIGRNSLPFSKYLFYLTTPSIIRRHNFSLRVRKESIIQQQGNPSLKIPIS